MRIFTNWPNTIVQVASGRFGVHPGYFEAGAAIEIKMGQGAKPGIGGHLPGSKGHGRRVAYTNDTARHRRNFSRSAPRYLFN